MSPPPCYDGALAEFASLRQEIDARVKAQFQTQNIQLTSVGAVFAFAVSRPDMRALLLVVPFSSYLLCRQLVSQHYGTLLVAQYIREELSPRVPDGLGWEAWILREGRRTRLQGTVLPLLLAFPGTGAVALAWTATLAFHGNGLAFPVAGGMVGLWVCGVALAIRSAVLVLSIPDSRPHPFRRRWTVTG